MDNWMMIVNPCSATKATAQTWEDSKKVLTDGGLKVDHVCTGHKAHAIELAQEAAEKGYRKFIAVGGETMAACSQSAEDCGASGGSGRDTSGIWGSMTSGV